MNSVSSQVNLATVSGVLDRSVPMTELLLPDGGSVRVETAVLLGQQRSAEAFGELAPQGNVREMIPLIEEQLEVHKKVVETGRVRLVKSVTEYNEQLNEPLAIRTFDIERVVVNQPVDVAPAVRQEGETTVYPVVEEQLVLTRQLILTEEVRVTRRETEKVDSRVVTLRREHLAVEREDHAR